MNSVAYPDGMADPLLATVRSEAKKTASRQAALYAAIRAAVEAGYSLRQVAEAAGITHTGVAKIVNRSSP